jgi:hypothetical protein
VAKQYTLIEPFNYSADSGFSSGTSKALVPFTRLLLAGYVARLTYPDSVFIDGAC